MGNNLLGADNQFGIPERFVEPVRNALTAAAAIGPAGLFGGIDAVAVGAVWTTLFVSIKNKSNSTLGSDPKKSVVVLPLAWLNIMLGARLPHGSVS